MPPVVSTARCDDYTPARVKTAVIDILNPLGGMKAFVSAGDRVLLKPNLVMAFAAERAVNTHPAVVRAVAELVQDCGGRILVGDSPGMGSAAKVAAACGITEALHGLDATIIEFSAASARENGQKISLGSLDMAQELADIDVLINLPKFKTHGMTGLTLGVKNCFGLVVGARKLQWHFRAGHNAELFSRMLIDVYEAASPALTILDAVIAMEGEGPTGGRPRPLNFLAAARSAHELDAFAASLVVSDLRSISTLAAQLKSKDDSSWSHPVVVGPDRTSLSVSDFELPPPRTHFHMGPLSWFGFLRRWITARPAVKPNACRSCAKCAQLCPAQAIIMEHGLPSIDDKPCIRCYCCHELCPHQAMILKSTWLGRMIAERRH